MNVRVEGDDRLDFNTQKHMQPRTRSTDKRPKEREREEKKDEFGGHFFA